MDSAAHEHPPHASPPVTDYRFCGFALDPARGVLHRPDGAEIGLRPKTTDVLCHLARKAGQVVSRDELMEEVWPGVVVTDDSITQCIAEIRRALGEEGAQLVRTWPKRGYTLAAEVTPEDVPPPPHAVPPGDVEADAAPPLAVSHSGVKPPVGRLRHIRLLSGTLLIAALVAAGWWAMASRQPNSGPLAVATGPPGASPATLLPARPLSLVVLPFANLGGNPGQEHFADGITADLTTALAQIPGSFVPGRGTALAYKDRAVDVRQIGRELGVRYVVQGSVRPVGAQLRVNVQVLDAASGAHLWAMDFNEQLADVANPTSPLASRIRAALGDSLIWIEGDRARANPTQDATAVELLMRGRALLNSPATVEDMQEARRLFERSLALDGNSADAHAYAGMNLVNLWHHDWAADREDLLRRAEEHARRALELNPWLARGHYVRGMVHQGRQRFDQALAAFEIAFALNPNQPNFHARRGWVKNLMGNPVEALADFEQAVRISPHHAYVGTTYWGMAFANLMLGRDADAAAHALRAVVGNPTLPDVRLQLASTLALVGRTEEARIALGEFRRLRPEMTVEHFRRRSREISGHPLWLATRDREAEALRAVGMPEE